MKRLVSFVLIIGLLCSVAAVAAGEEVRWDLQKLPAIEEYYLDTYGDFEAEELVFFGVGGGFSKEDAKAAAGKIARLLSAIPFEPSEKQIEFPGDAGIQLYFEHAEDFGQVAHVFILPEGVLVADIARKDWVKHSAFIEMDTQKLTADIRSLMSDTIRKVNQYEEQQAQQQKEERAKYETELSSFRKLYSAKVPKFTFRLTGTTQMPLEVGICSYQPVGSAAPVYAYYLELNENGVVRVADSIDKNNTVSFYELKIYQDKDNHKYYLNRQNQNELKCVVTLGVTADGALGTIDAVMTHSNFKGSAKRGEFTENGTLKAYGDLKLPVYTDAGQTQTTEQPETNKPDAEQPKPEDKTLVTDTESNKTDPNTEDKKQEQQQPENGESEKQPEKQEDEKQDGEQQEGGTLPAETEKQPPAPVGEITAQTYLECANCLNQLGLLRGTENGYELESEFTRAQGAAMLVRLLGEEKAALERVPQGIFTDVPADSWAAAYVEYCYENSITKGTGGNQYSPETPMNGQQYMTLVLRALGYMETEPDNAAVAAVECGLLPETEAEKVARTEHLKRNSMVYIAYQALTVQQPDGKTLIETLAENRAIKEETARQLGFLK